MTARTRYFVIASLLVLGVGVGTGLIAYYVQTIAFSGRGESEELRYLPHDASVVAYANVHEVMTSELRQRLRQAAPMQMQENGQREFQNETGINIETDVDHIVACLEPNGANMPGSGMVLARGRFDESKIEALMREHGAQIEEYKNKRLIVGDQIGVGKKESPAGGVAGTPDVVPAKTDRVALTFIEPGLVAVGGTGLVRHAIDLHASGGESVVSNDELMNLVRSLDKGNAWAVGRFDALRSSANLPPGVAAQLPPITWFSISGRVDGGLSGVVRADTSDEAAAKNLRDVVGGLLALAKLQVGSKPEFQALLQSLELGGAGKTVVLSFEVPAKLFDLLGAAGSKKPEQH